MGKKDRRVDAYIARAAQFAKPILTHIRELVHQACPDVDETLKWSFPHFQYKGIICGMAAFKQHCALVFWKGKLILGSEQDRSTAGGKAMGQFGRLTTLSDLPSDRVLSGYIKEAVRLNAEGVKAPPRNRNQNRKLAVPDYFLEALRKNKKALATFESFRPSHKREYVEWVTEAKRDDTRKKRLETAIQWMAAGKSRDWKYENC